MAYRLLADATMALHGAFIVFVVCGGFLVLRDARWAYAHLPAVAWVVWLESSGAICPLTPLENAWRALAGEAGYAGGFIDHYLVPIIYPTGLTSRIQWLMGGLVAAVNASVYWMLWRRRRRKRLQSP